MAEERLTKAQLKEQRKQERQQWEQQMDKAQRGSTMKKLGMWAIGGLLILLSIWGLYALVTAPAPNQQSLSATMPALTANEVSEGPTDAKVTLVEYADFECPACQAYWPLVKQLTSDFNGKLHYVYRFFPLTAIHPNAQISAQAGYAAVQQGKFFQMEDLLFTNNKEWETSTDPQPIFVKYAQQLGMDTNKFTQDMNSQAAKDYIQKQEDAGTNAGVNATPTFFINGKQIQNPSGYQEFKDLIQNAMK